MPANRKRPDLRQDNRDSRALQVVDNDQSTQVVPDGDSRWLKATKEAWTAFWASQLAHAVEQPDRHALLRLFTMRDLQERAFRGYKKQPFVDGSMGQPVTNPQFDNAMKLERAIVQLEDRLGLSPKARANLGIAIGQAQLTAAELNRQAREAIDSDEVVDVELAAEWEAS